MDRFGNYEPSFPIKLDEEDEVMKELAIGKKGGVWVHEQG